MNATVRLVLIGVFAALAIALNVAGPKIPAPYAPFLFYQLWEIPIVVAFLAIGPVEGIAVSVINTLVLFAYFQGSLPSGPFYNLIAMLSMFLGIYIPYKLATRSCPAEKLSEYLRSRIGIVTISLTVMGIVTRVVVTTGVNYFALQQPFPIGFSFTQPAALAFLPLSILFNATVAVYTIPIAIAITIVILRVLPNTFSAGKKTTTTFN
jgi:riboflavin transporter FmnP